MSTPTAQEMTLDAIRSVPLFASLDDRAATELRELLRTRDAEADTTLFRAGDEGDAMYLIESGRVRIAVSDDDKREIVLAELARGDFFGEMAIIDGKKRSADATVIEPARLAVLSREALPREQQLATTILEGNKGNEATALEDVWWALTHSDEAVLDR